MTSKLKNGGMQQAIRNGSSSVQWTNANDQTAWEPEGPICGIEMNSIETKCIEQDELGQNWLRLNYDSGAAATALPIAIAGDLPLRMFINKSDGEPAMKALKDAAAKALEGVESISQESPVGDHQANGDIESTVRTLKAQMRATRFALESRLGRQLAHDDPILTWIPTFTGDTITRFRKGSDGKTPWEREQGKKMGRRLIGVRRTLLHERGVCGKLGRRLPEAERWDQTGWQDLKGIPWNLRPTGVPEPEVNIEAQPGAAEAERRKRGRSEPVRARDETQLEGVRENRAKFDEASSAPASGADANEDDGIQSKKTRGKDTRGRDFYVTKKDVERFGPTARCPACANATKGISGRHAHNDECRDRIGKLLMDEGAQRIKNYFE